MPVWPLLLLSLLSPPAAASVIPPPPPGVRYDIGGYLIHLYCIGEGQPTVIIDTGLGDDSSDWLAVQRDVAEFSRVCVYDRPGYGWSDTGPRPRSSQRIADELDLLLEAAHLAPPYLLVGHSFGGYNMRVFAGQHPDDIAGIILVDASHERQFDMLDIKLPRNASRRNALLILPKPGDAGVADKSQYLRERAIRAARMEIASMYQSVIQVMHSPMLPPVPLVVISRGMPEWRDRPDADSREKVWIRLQQDLRRLSPISSHIFAHRSGHDVHIEQPEIVVHAIADMIGLHRVGQ